MTMPKMQLCPETTEVVLKRKPHLIPVEEAIKRMIDEIEASREYITRSDVNGYVAASLINKFRRLIKGNHIKNKSTRKKKIKTLCDMSDNDRTINEVCETIPFRTNVSFYRKKLLEKGRCRCAYCGCKLGEKRATIDHIQPKSRGGSNAPDNLILSCQRCNGIKGSRTVIEWAADILAVHK